MRDRSLVLFPRAKVYTTGTGEDSSMYKQITFEAENLFTIVTSMDTPVFLFVEQVLAAEASTVAGLRAWHFDKLFDGKQKMVRTCQVRCRDEG